MGSLEQRVIKYVQCEGADNVTVCTIRERAEQLL